MGTRRWPGVGLVLAGVLLSACAEDAHPAQMEWEYTFAEDAFLFENLSSDQAQFELTPALAARMFGAEATCVDGALPCTPKPAAQVWIDQANRGLAAGFSEGFAIASILFATGELDPNDFGAATAAELRFGGNVALQAELAYWAASQHALPPSTNRRFQASDVMPFLVEEAFASGGERYRLAIARRTASGFDYAHSLVPIGYYRGQARDLYYLRVYDSNRPEQEQAIVIDEAANSWTYDVTLGDGTELHYEGNASNGNFLYFAPVSARRGELAAPFAGGGTTVTTEGSLGVLARTGGARVGFEDGAVVEEGGEVIPVFASCNCGSRGPLRYTIPADSTEGMVEVTYSGGVGMDTEEGTGSVVVTKEGEFSVQITGIDGDATAQDTVTVSADGDLTLSSNSGTPVSATVTYEDEDGSEVSVTVTVEEGASGVEVGLNDDGDVVVRTSGVEMDAPARVEVTRTTADGTSTSATSTYRSAGEEMMTQVTVDTETGETSGVTVESLCENGVQDDLETDVDCGGDTCGGCAVGEMCNVDDDCEGLCASGRCRNAGCEDERTNDDETDVDCGGPLCLTCADTKACTENSDCSSSICNTNICRTPRAPFMNVQGLIPGTTLAFDVTMDGATTTQSVTVMTRGDFRHALSPGYAYTVTLRDDDPSYLCRFDDGGGSTTATRSGTTDSALDLGMVRCGYTQNALNVNVQGLPGGAVVEITTELDGMAGTTSFNQIGRFNVGNFVTTYRATILRQPGRIAYGGGQADVSCGFGNGLSADTGVQNPGTAANLALRCRVDVVEMDAGVPMTDGGIDGGPNDGGVDAGPTDASVDAGPSDAGVDAGPADAGFDAGPPPMCMSGCTAAFDVPTTDGVAASGTWTVPANCTTVNISAWGAGGGAGGELMGFPALRGSGGPGGLVSGTMSVAEGDVFTVWIGQGGILGENTGLGTPGIGSLHGTLTSGGRAYGTDFAGGSGGGLTSVRRTGSATTLFSVPGGGGGGQDGFTEGGYGGDGTSGGGASNAGDPGDEFDMTSGGGAGEPGGTAGDFVSGGAGGAFGVLPVGLTGVASSDGSTPRRYTNTDFPMCTDRLGFDNVGGGGNLSGSGQGGDGCVVIRCVP